MKLLTALFLFITVSIFGAVPDYKAFRGTGGITIVSNPPTGTIVIDGSGTGGSAAGDTYNVQFNSNDTFSANVGVNLYPYNQFIEFGGPYLTINDASGGTNAMDATGFGTISTNKLTWFVASSPLWHLWREGTFVPVGGRSNLNDIGSFLLPVRTNWANNVTAANILVNHPSFPTITLRRIESVDAGGAIVFVGNDGGEDASVNYGNYGGPGLELAAGGAMRMYLRGSDGFVAIGNASPANRLDVEGAVAIGASYSGTSTAPANGLIVEGNVGIGTASPGTKLVVQEPANTGTTTNVFIVNPDTSAGFHGESINLGYASTTDGASSRIVGSQNPASAFYSRLQLQTHANSAGVWNDGILINEVGNVGINTTTPLESLHVVGGIVQTNGGIWQTFTTGAPSAPATQGAVYWNDGTNLCAVFRNGAGTLTTNKLSMTAWP